MTIAPEKIREIVWLDMNDSPVCRQYTDGNPGLRLDSACVMYYSLQAVAGMQFGVAPAGEPEECQSPHCAALRVQRKNGLGREEGMVWISTPEGPYRMAVIQTGTGELRPFEIWMGDTLITRYNPDGTKEEFFKGFPMMRNEPNNGSIVYQTTVKFPVMQLCDFSEHTVLLNAEPGTEVNFIDSDGLIKKAIKQRDDGWTRVCDNSRVCNDEGPSSLDV